jgi:TolA-binding protein
MPASQQANQSTTDLAATQAAKRVLFAVPFENATQQEQYAPAASGMGDLIAVMLAQQDNVRVVERQKLDALTAEQALALRGLTGGNRAIAAGKLLMADTVITGRLYMVKGELTLTAQAIDIASHRVLAASELSTRPECMVEDSLQMARDLAKQMALPLPEIDTSKIDKSPIAALHFAQALGHYYAGNLDAAIMQFMRAIDLDPDYTESHYWQGMCYAKQGEDAHAIIEFEAFLKEQPASNYAPQAKKLLAQAKTRDNDSAVPRLRPCSQPATQAAVQ